MQIRGMEDEVDILKSANEPKKASGDAGSVEQRPSGCAMTYSLGKCVFSTKLFFKDAMSFQSFLVKVGSKSKGYIIFLDDDWEWSLSRDIHVSFQRFTRRRGHVR